MNPLTVRIFDDCRKRVNTRFLDMCMTSGINAATAPVIFEKMNAILNFHDISWENCIALSVDNTSVNIVRHNLLCQGCMNLILIPIVWDVLVI